MCLIPLICNLIESTAYMYFLFGVMLDMQTTQRLDNKRSVIEPYGSSYSIVRKDEQFGCIYAKQCVLDN